MPQAWLARFGRTVAEQVIDAVEGRFRAPRARGLQATLAGQQVVSGLWREQVTGRGARRGRALDAAAGGSAKGCDAPEAPGDAAPGAAAECGAGTADPDPRTAREKAAEAAAARAELEETITKWLRSDETQDTGELAGLATQEVTLRQLLTGSSFAFTGEAESGGLLSLWGRGGMARFAGREGGLSLDGEAVNAMLGAEWTGDPQARRGGAAGAGAGSWTAGLLLSHARGEGRYHDPAGTGAAESALTGLFPYGRLALGDRVTLWGVTGYGAGELTLAPEKQTDAEAEPAAMRTDMDLVMGAVGLRGTVLPARGGAAGPELAVKHRRHGRAHDLGEGCGAGGGAGGW